MSVHHKTLGVADDASKEEVNAAYRKLAKQYHPDRNPGDLKAANTFNQITQARTAIIDILEGRVSVSDADYTLTLNLFDNIFGTSFTLEDETIGIPPGTLPGDLCRVTLNTGKKVVVEITYVSDDTYKVEGSDLRCKVVVAQEMIDEKRAVTFLDHSGMFSNSVKFGIDIKTGDVCQVNGLGLRNSSGPNSNLLIDVTVIPRKPVRSKVPVALIITLVISFCLYLAQGHV